MKKFKTTMFALFFILATGNISADEISLQQAKVMAADYITMPQLQKTKAKSTEALSSEKLFNHFYCFNGRKGFVLIADDNCVQPVLGYADEGSFDMDNLPTALTNWLQAVSEYIEQNKGTASKKAMKKKGAPVVAPLITTKWNQDTPYNYMTPVDGTATGCGATAMAQIVNYHQWPVHGYGSRTYTSNCSDDSTNATYNSKKISMDFSKSVYDYANMADEYATTENGQQWTEAQRSAVAKLMLDCGVAASMQYGISVSYSTTPDIAYGLSEHFGYKTKYYVHETMLTSEFMKIITDELDGKNPVCMNSTVPFIGAAHAFVIDGYDSGGFLHVNIGASGTYDGYYDLCDIGSYRYKQEIVTAHPNRAEEEFHYDYVPIFVDYSPNVFHNGGVDIIDKPADSFTVTLNSLFVFSFNNYEGYEGLALYRGKNFVQLLDTAHVSLPGLTNQNGRVILNYLDSLTLTVPKSVLDTLPDGAYTIAPVCIGNGYMKSGSSPSAENIRTNFYFNDKRLFLSLNSGIMSVSCIQQYDSLNLKCQFTCDTTYRVGVYDEIPLKAKIRSLNAKKSVFPLLATLRRIGSSECDTLFYSYYLIYGDYATVFTQTKQVLSKSEVGRYVFSLSYNDADRNDIPLISPADSVIVVIYDDSTCMKPTIDATLIAVSDYNTGENLDINNLKTGGENEPTEIFLTYSTKYGGNTNVPYDYRIMLNDTIEIYQGQITYDFSDENFYEDINILNRAKLYGNFKLAFEYKLADDSIWMPLDKNQPYLYITSDIATDVSQKTIVSGNADTPYYTLQGVRISQPTLKGIYIRKGKKMVVE